MRLLVGCPVYKRDWIIERWVNAALAATDLLGPEWTTEFIFAGNAEDPTYAAIPLDTFEWVETNEPLERRDVRDWGSGPKHRHRFEQMVAVRNALLGGVRVLQPDLFLSLDSDILLHRNAIPSMQELLPSYDAVGGLAYLGGGVTTNAAYLTRARGLRRAPSGNACKVDILMAVKLMKPTAYGVDYVYDRQGEDIGWSKACAERGYRLGWDGRVASWHVMSRDELSPDKRVTRQPWGWE